MRIGLFPIPALSPNLVSGDIQGWPTVLGWGRTLGGTASHAGDKVGPPWLGASSLVTQVTLPKSRRGFRFSHFLPIAGVTRLGDVREGLRMTTSGRMQPLGSGFPPVHPPLGSSTETDILHWVFRHCLVCSRGHGSLRSRTPYRELPPAHGATLGRHPKEPKRPAARSLCPGM